VLLLPTSTFTTLIAGTTSCENRPQDPALEQGWGRLAIKVLSQPRGRGAAQLLVEVPFPRILSTGSLETLEGQ
jgi:hypothetical protein